MKRFKLSIIFFILGLNISAQNKLSVSFDASPTLSYRNYKLIDYSQGDYGITSSGKFYYDRFLNLTNPIESSKYGFQLSLNLDYSITKNISIQAGIQYKNIGIRYDIHPLIHTLYINGSSYYDYAIESEKVYSKFQYIGIPISLEYKVYSFNKFKLAINAGGTIDFLTSHEEGSKLLPYQLSTQMLNYLDYTKKTYNVNGGIKLYYIINEKWEAYLMPQYVQYLTPNKKIGFYYGSNFYYKINQYNYFWTLKFGIKFRI